MERVRKTVFDPLATSKARIREILAGLPAGSAHPFSPERILLCRTDEGFEEIDITSYPEDFFFNAVDLGEMGEILLRRMAGFQDHLAVFGDFAIQQAPASTFKIPIVSNQITILAVSELTPTYYDFCFADASCNACCWLAKDTFPGITHSGDITRNRDLLDYVKINKQSLTEKEICVFISGYQCTRITQFLGTNPALLVADHVDKVLYIVPVPLDAATIGDATICCPLVIKRDGDSLICSILPTATTDSEMMCHSNKLRSPCFPEAIRRADFTVSTLSPCTTQPPSTGSNMNAVNMPQLMDRDNAIIATNSATLPLPVDLDKTQIIRFGTGIDFRQPGDSLCMAGDASAVVLPCIFGSQLEGPVLLATGAVPSNVPFSSEGALIDYYKKLKSLVVLVDDRMTDNARNLATGYRLNALFIVQLNPDNIPRNTDEVLSLLNSANINAVTAMAGPQSLVLIQIGERYYFYRGLANRAYLNTSHLAFGSDVTFTLNSAGMESMTDPRITRVFTRDTSNIILPTSGQVIQPQDLQKLFERLAVDQIRDLEEDITGVVPQLQMLLSQKELQELSQSLVTTLSVKISNATAATRDAYLKFLTQEYSVDNPESVKKKNEMLGEFRKTTKQMQTALEPAISSLANLMSSQMTSKRTHDIKRLARQAQIQSNVTAVSSMTFETLAGYLETHAADMGVMVMNIETDRYRQLLGNLTAAAIDARSCCDLDSRVLHLEGFDAGIILEQSQSRHNGPLRSQAGPSHPIMALPYLTGQGSREGSMLAWVCWDEFVNLKSPFTVRWLEKCNEAHIAALRIMMRDTLSKAVVSREHNIQPGSPETGHLMSALLMAAMSKLAAMKTSVPNVSEDAEDTVTRLMRGLFGNLLTIAGSGVRPLSMVWQLFGQNPQYDIPTTEADWVWYQTVVALYPYTGWPLDGFYENLERLLDKAIVRVITKNEDMATVKQSRTSEMFNYCRLRNIQLHHSRTLITTLMRMLTEDNDIRATATRLLEHLPRTLERQTEGYTRMIKCLEHLSNGGQRRPKDDLVVANTYTSRSAAFAELKAKVSEACQRSDWVAMKKACQAILDKHAEIATLWHVNSESLKVQNMKLYKALLDADMGVMDPSTKTRNLELTRQVLGDAEMTRVPWELGKPGEFGNKIETLDEAFVHEALTGEKPESIPIESGRDAETKAQPAMETKTEDEFAQFESSVVPAFVSKMQKDLSAEDVCYIVKIPVATMHVFAKALNPQLEWEDLGKNFKVAVLGLLRDRSNRVESRPIKTVLGLGIGKKEMLQIEG